MKCDYHEISATVCGKPSILSSLTSIFQFFVIFYPSTLRCHFVDFLDWQNVTSRILFVLPSSLKDTKKYFYNSEFIFLLFLSLLLPRLLQNLSRYFCPVIIQ